MSEDIRGSRKNTVKRSYRKRTIAETKSDEQNGVSTILENTKELQKGRSRMYGLNASVKKEIVLLDDDNADFTPDGLKVGLDAQFTTQTEYSIEAQHMTNYIEKKNQGKERRL